MKLAGFIGSIATSLESYFPDIMFTGEDGGRPLKIGSINRSARYIRIRLAKVGFLHLSSLALKGIRPNGEKIDLASARVEISSIYGGTDVLLQEKRFLQPKRRQRYGFHTAKEEDPWLVVDLNEDCMINELTVWNRNDGHHARASSIVVEISSDKEVWISLYDGLQRQAELKAHIVALQEGLRRYGYSAKEKIVASEIVGSFYLGNLKKAEKTLASRALRPESVTEIRTAFTEAILAQKCLEWNIHGIRRTFRFWSQEEKGEYISMCSSIVEKLRDTVSQDVCLGFGSVLSLVRDRDLIPHDDDLDIIVCFKRNDCPTITEGLSRIENALADGPYDVGLGRYKAHRQISRAGGKSVDVFVGLEEEGKVSWYPQRRGTLNYSDVFPSVSAPLLGMDVSIPANPFRYLESVYGPSWHIPDSGWRHNWDISLYADIL